MKKWLSVLERHTCLLKSAFRLQKCKGSNSKEVAGFIGLGYFKSQVVRCFVRSKKFFIIFIVFDCKVNLELCTYSRRQKKVSVHYLRYVISTIKARLHSTELVRSCKAYLHRGSTALSAHFQRTLIRTFTILHTQSLR